LKLDTVTDNWKCLRCNPT